MATTPATTRKRKAADDPDTDVHDITYDDERGVFTARLFDETDPFEFDTDVNSFLMSGALSADAESIGSMRRLVMSLVLVPGADDLEGDDLEVRRAEEKRRFTTLVESQPKFTWERYGRLMADLLAAAGKDPTNR